MPHVVMRKGIGLLLDGAGRRLPLQYSTGSKSSGWFSESGPAQKQQTDPARQIA